MRAQARSRANPPVGQVAIMVTRRCNMTCSHCSVESNPTIRKQPSEEELLDRVRQAATAGVRSILFTGGEPLMRREVLLELMHEAQRLGVDSAVTTNGFWGRSLEAARRHLRDLKRAGLVRLTVSYDRFHAEFQGPEPALNICAAAAELQMVVHISITRLAHDRDLEGIVAPFRRHTNAMLRFYDVQPVGAAKRLAGGALLRDEIEGFCSACESPAITDDGRVTACNGPSYFAQPGSPLLIGDLTQATFAVLAERHRSDPVLETIRTFGPGRLRDELQSIPEFADLLSTQEHRGTCALCQHITSNPQAVAALRKRLDHSKIAAERLAIRQLIDDNKQLGRLTRDYANGAGASRVFLRAICDSEARWTRESERVLGRADVDWNHLAQYLVACGLARPLQPVLGDAALQRWAPQFFGKRITEATIHAGLREAVQHEALRRISEVLESSGLSGVLLKGAAILARSDRETYQGRSTSDIDVLVDPSRAVELRSTLLQHGFTGSTDAPRTGPHHLAPVRFKQVPVEIHTRIVPAWWGLPETALLSRVTRTDAYPALGTLDPEGMCLHAAVHTTAHLFSFGLKTAWDIRWILDQSDSLDWDRLVEWATQLRAPRSFWVPLRVLAQELELPIPPRFLSRAPSDKHQGHLELIARHRLFQCVEGPYELNPISKNVVFLGLHDTWRGRLRYASSLLAPSARESRKTALARGGIGQNIKGVLAHLREAGHAARQFRRALGKEVRET